MNYAGSLKSEGTRQTPWRAAARTSGRGPYRGRVLAVAGAIICAASCVTTYFAPTAHAQVDEPTITAIDGPESPSSARCQNLSFPVRMKENDPTTWSLFGQFCSRGPISAQTPVQLLIHGGANNHAYWDFPSQPETYSYVETATKRGFATLNIDRLGYGLSDRPPASSLDFNMAAYTVHQLVTYLREGALGPKFATVVLNGHSMGGLTAQVEASTYRDVDAVIVSGIGHHFGPGGSAHLADKIWPADMDEKYMGKGLPVGYVTTKPGVRLEAFTAPGLVDPAIATYDELVKDTASPAELISLTTISHDPSVTQRIQVPVLHALGRHDSLWCTTTHDCATDPTATSEAQFYSPEVHFTQVIVDDAGHSINLNTVAPQFYDTTFNWLTAQGVAPQP